MSEPSPLLDRAGIEEAFRRLGDRLPAQLRRAWELKFPVLAEISRVAATA